MKQFKKPEFKINKINDYSEPVFMACSGQEHFVNVTVSGGYEHQYPQTGRNDCRYQVGFSFTAESGYRYDGPVYVYLRFPIADVSVDRVSDWSKVYSSTEGNETIWVGVHNYTLQQGNDVQFGDLIAHFIRDTSLDVPVPEIAFALSWDGSTICK